MKYFSILSLLLVFVANSVLADLPPFDPNEVIKVKTPHLNAKFDPGSKGKALGKDQEISPSAVTGTWLPIAGTITAPTRGTWYRYDVNVSSIPVGSLYETLTYSWVVKGGYSGGFSDVSATDIWACVNTGLAMQACGDLRNTIYSVEHDTSDFAVSFPVWCTSYCSNPPTLSLFIRVPLNPNDQYNLRYDPPVSATLSSKLYVTLP